MNEIEKRMLKKLPKLIRKGEKERIRRIKWWNRGERKDILRYYDDLLLDGLNSMENRQEIARVYIRDYKKLNVLYRFMRYKGFNVRIIEDKVEWILPKVEE